MDTNKTIQYMHHKVGKLVLLARCVSQGDSSLYQLYDKNDGWVTDDYALGMFFGEESGESITAEQAKKDIEAIKG